MSLQSRNLAEYTFKSNKVLQQYVLTDITPTGKILGTGSYGIVLEVIHGTLKCAAKKMQESYLQTDHLELQSLVEKYEQECQIMASLRHPNVTQFLGICYLPDAHLPLLVMERLDMSLDDLLENVPNLPLTLKLSFLDDICMGLDYLHKQNPPIIHRDLTARNILLTSSLLAKISDMGNSRIAFMKPGQLAKTLSKLPGTLVYMPPEAQSDDHCYGPSLDIFSLGHLALYILTQVFPGNLLPYTYCDPDNLGHIQGRTEVQRRESYVQRLDTCVPSNCTGLIELVKECLDDCPEDRPSSGDLLKQVHAIRKGLNGSPSSGLLRIVDVGKVLLHREMKKTEEKMNSEGIRQVEDKMKEKELLQQQIDHGNECLQSHENDLHDLEILLQQKQVMLQKQLEQMQQQGLELQQNEENLKSTREQLKKTMEEVNECEQKLMLEKKQLNFFESELTDTNNKLSLKIEETKSKEKEVLQTNLDLSELDEKLQSTLHFHHSIQKSFTESERINVEIEGEIDKLQKELWKSQEQLLKAKAAKIPKNIKWTRGPSMPFGMTDYIQSVIVQETVYIGGGHTGKFFSNRKFGVMAYNTKTSTWHKLPPYTSSSFAMVVMNNKLVLVGGRTQSGMDTNMLGKWEANKWTCPYQPMLTSRSHSSAVFYKRWLVVAGGMSNGHILSTVEIFQAFSNQWYSAPPSPTPWHSMNSTVLDDTWYLVGGYNEDDNTAAFSIPLPPLISLSISGSSEGTDSCKWTKKSINRMNSFPVSMDGILLAVGGVTRRNEPVSSIYCYTPGSGTSFEVGLPPSPLSSYACAITLDNKLLLFESSENSFLFYEGTFC